VYVSVIHICKCVCLCDTHLQMCMSLWYTFANVYVSVMHICMCERDAHFHCASVLTWADAGVKTRLQSSYLIGCGCLVQKRPIKQTIFCKRDLWLSLCICANVSLSVKHICDAHLWCTFVIHICGTHLWYTFVIHINTERSTFAQMHTWRHTQTHLFLCETYKRTETRLQCVCVFHTDTVLCVCVCAQLRTRIRSSKHPLK